MKRKTIIIACVVFVVLSNFWPIKTLFELLVDYDHYSYSNGDGRFKFSEMRRKGRVFRFSRTFSEEDRKHMPGADTNYYRNFTKNPFAFWRYRDYLTDPIYTLPYKSRKDLPKATN